METFKEPTTPRSIVGYCAGSIGSVAEAAGHRGHVVRSGRFASARFSEDDTKKQGSPEKPGARRSRTGYSAKLDFRLRFSRSWPHRPLRGSHERDRRKKSKRPGPLRPLECHLRLSRCPHSLPPVVLPFLSNPFSPPGMRFRLMDQRSRRGTWS